MSNRRIQNSRILELNRVLKKAAKEYNAPVWNAVRKYLTKPRRRRVAVNISKINRYTEEGDFVVVPGKVLSCGELSHEVTIAAFDFSAKALEKINRSNCKALSIEDLIKINPKGSRVKIIV